MMTTGAELSKKSGKIMTGLHSSVVLEQIILFNKYVGTGIIFRKI